MFPNGWSRHSCLFRQVNLHPSYLGQQPPTSLSTKHSPRGITSARLHILQGTPLLQFMQPKALQPSSLQPTWFMWERLPQRAMCMNWNRRNTSIWCSIKTIFSPFPCSSHQPHTKSWNVIHLSRLWAWSMNEKSGEHWEVLVEGTTYSWTRVLICLGQAYCAEVFTYLRIE